MHVDAPREPGERSGVTRRDSLVRLGGLTAGLLGVTAWDVEAEATVPPAPGRPPSRPPRDVRARAGADRGPVLPRGRQGAARCPRGASGRRALSRTTVVDVSSCNPIRGAAVDIWHCDAPAPTRASPEGTEGSGSCAASSAPTAPASPCSTRSIPAGTRGGRFTSTSRCTSVATSSTRGSSTSRTRSPTSSIAGRRTTDGRADDAERDGRDLPERRQPLDAEARARRSGYVGRITMGVQTR